MIELQNINKRYQTASGEVIALQDVNVTVRRGDIFGVIGRSGAGKSTLIRTVNLLERPTTGLVRVNDQTLTDLTRSALQEARHRIGMIFQHFNLLSTRTVFDNVALPLELLKKDKAFIQKTVTPLLELVGLDARKNAYPSQLSGGQKQRVAIARALATKPNVLLCDEMTSALDPETSDSILKLIKRINTEFQLTILLITHEMEVIKKVADRVAVMDQGRIIESTDVVSLFRHPQSEVARSFIQSSLKPDLPKEFLSAIKAQPLDNSSMILRIAFVGEAAGKPVIDDLIRHCNVSVNILQANLEYLRRETVGMMIVALEGKVEGFSQVAQYLDEHKVESEVLGYVSRDDWVH